MAAPRPSYTRAKAGAGYIPVDMPVTKGLIAGGVERLRKVGKRKGYGQDNRYHNLTVLQDAIGGAGQIASAPVMGLLSPAVEAVADRYKAYRALPRRQQSVDADAADMAAQFSPGASRSGGGQGLLAGGLNPMLDRVEAFGRRMLGGIDNTADDIGYPRDLFRELVGAGASVAAGPAAKGFLRGAEGAGEALEGAAGRLGYTLAPEEGLLAAGVGPRRRRPSGGGDNTTGFDASAEPDAGDNGLLGKAARPGIGHNGGPALPDARRVNNSRTPLDAIHPAAISSRLPGPSSPEHGAAMRRHLVPGIMAMSRDPRAFAQNIGTLADIPGFARLRGMDPMKAARMAERQMADNLLSIKDKMSPEYWNATKNWYPQGADFVVRDHMNRYGFGREQVSSALANLSPSTLWDLNVEQANRLGGMFVNNRGNRMTDTLEQIAHGLWDKGDATTAVGRKYLDRTRDLMTGKESIDDLLRQGRFEDAAIIMQMIDRDVGPKPFPMIYPWGQYGPTYPRKYSPNTVSLMGNALKTMYNPTRQTISDVIAPDAHKIRSFYNTILAPHGVRDEVVSDTHSVGASLLLPYSNKSAPVEANFGFTKAGVTSSKKTGSSGTYGIYADAHRRAADIIGDGSTAWNVQSPTWSGIRDVFDKAMKKPQNVARIEGIWRQVDSRKMSIKEARDEIWKILLDGGDKIPDPGWLGLAPR